MAHQLGHHQYGKAQVRVVRVFRDADPHEIVDLNVSVSLAGEIGASWLAGDNGPCLTTDAMKNTVNAYARERDDAVRTPEAFGLALARHFVADLDPVRRARVAVESYGWRRLEVAGAPSPHAFARDGSSVRTATVTARADAPPSVVSGVRELTVLKTTDSEYEGFLVDPYTTLQPTTDRVMATSVTGQWLHAADRDAAWNASYPAVLGAMTSAFAGHHSRALQQTLFAMGSAALDADEGVAEVRLSLPNKHHFVVDLSPFGLDNPNLVLHADDRPYGLIEGTVRREGVAPSGDAFDPGQGW